MLLFIPQHNSQINILIQWHIFSWRQRWKIIYRVTRGWQEYYEGWQHWSKHHCIFFFFLTNDIHTVLASLLFGCNNHATTSRNTRKMLYRPNQLSYLYCIFKNPNTKFFEEYDSNSVSAFVCDEPQLHLITVSHNITAYNALVH